MILYIRTNWEDGTTTLEMLEAPTAPPWICFLAVPDSVQTASMPRLQIKVVGKDDAPLFNYIVRVQNLQSHNRHNAFTLQLNILFKPATYSGGAASLHFEIAARSSLALVIVPHLLWPAAKSPVHDDRSLPEV